MKIMLYGRLAHTIASEIEIDAPAGCSIADLRQRLAAAHPGAADTLSNRRALACVGGSLVRDDYSVGPADCVEFLPPVSGG